MILNSKIADTIRQGLIDYNRVEIPKFGVFERLPRRKGKTFCGFRNKEGKARYSKRVRFTSDKQLKDDICK